MNGFRRLGERGVAMVTVLFVGAALTAVTSVAAFATIQEFGAGRNDRKASEALSYAEAGLDRFLSYMRSGTGPSFASLNKAGCPDPIPLPGNRAGVIGKGTFTASIEVYDPTAVGDDRFAPGACDGRPVSPRPGQDGHDKTYFVIESKGQFPAATRVVRQVVAITPGNLPIGIYANSITKQSADHDFIGVSMTSATTIQNRSSLDFEGLDPYYKYKDFFPQGVVGVDPNSPIPAAAHAVTGIYLEGSSSPEFGGSNGTKNCTANGTSGAGAYQSIWDSDGSAGSGTITSGCGSTPGQYPKTSKFTADQLAKFSSPELTPEDHAAMKSVAKASGIYCSFKGAGGTGVDFCTRAGVSIGTGYEAGIQALLSSGVNNIVAYFEFRSGTPDENYIERLGSIWGCAEGKSIVAVVKNGGVDYSGGSTDYINGAIIIDGNWTGNGKFVFKGSLIAKGNVHFHSSAQEFQLDDCWVQNMPSIFLKIVPGHWSEVDR
jgi:hypothetical protein